MVRRGDQTGTIAIAGQLWRWQGQGHHEPRSGRLLDVRCGRAEVCPYAARNTGRQLPESRSEPYQTVMFRKAAGHADLAFWAGEQESTMLMKPSTTHYLRRIKSGLSARGEWSSAMRLIGQAGRLFNSPRHDMDSSRTNGSPLMSRSAFNKAGQRRKSSNCFSVTKP
jgi:hypothetical protein